MISDMECNKISETSQNIAVQKYQGYEFWKNTLKEARYIVAPMVDQSELAWRILSRRHSAHLCYTPMFHSGVFVRDPIYRRENFVTCPEDRPLIVQFCGNDPDVIVKAGQMVQDMCDAVDINIGCPQAIAKRGHYGAFLQDEWDLLEKIISACHKHLTVPITVKIRVFDSIEKTVEYAKHLERAGAQLLTVHGRTREQKGPQTGLASWKHIKAVREAVNIPVFANGNIQYLTDVEDCIRQTGAHGVMIAEGSLHNPALFDGINPPVWEMVDEYLTIVELYPCDLTSVRGHIFKMCLHAFDVYNDWRIKLGDCKSFEKVKEVMKDFSKVLKEDEAKYKENVKEFNFGKCRFPYWICQSYERPQPVSENEENQDKIKRQKAGTDDSLPEELRGLSRKKLRKALHKPHKQIYSIQNPGRGKFELCVQCKANARGGKCEQEMCKVCCRTVCRDNKLNCVNHNLYYHSSLPRRERQNSQGEEKSATSDLSLG